MSVTVRNVDRVPTAPHWAIIRFDNDDHAYTVYEDEDAFMQAFSALVNTSEWTRTRVFGIHVDVVAKAVTRVEVERFGAPEPPARRGIEL